MTEAPARTGFAADIRAATWTGHQSAETTRFWASITGSSFDAAAYAALQSQLYFVYDALEGALDEAVEAAAPGADPQAAAIAALYAPELSRTGALREDLADLLGADWADRIRPLPSTTAYLARLSEVAASPGALLAHHYTRYLGDLSGGLFIGRRVKANLAREGNSGVRFYVFDQIEDADAFKNAYRDGLDALPLDEREQAAIIQEIVLAYELNTALLADLDADFARAVV
jgi:heme oxygenase